MKDERCDEDNKEYEKYMFYVILLREDVLRTFDHDDHVELFQFF